jgi:hypothetical protein
MLWPLDPAWILIVPIVLDSQHKLHTSEGKKVAVPVPAMKTYMRSRGIGQILNLDTRWGWLVNTTLRPLYREETTPVPTEEEDGWIFWRREKTLSPDEIWTLVCNLVTIVKMLASHYANFLHPLITST